MHLRKISMRHILIVLMFTLILLVLFNPLIEAVTGEVVWTREIGTASQVAYSANSVAVDRDRNTYVVGAIEGGYPDKSFLRKYGPRGKVLWTKMIITARRTTVNDVAVGRGGNVYVGGSVDRPLPNQTGKGGTDAFIRKYSSGGGIHWTRQFGTKGYDQVLGLAVGPSGNIVVVGETDRSLPRQKTKGGTDAFVRKYSPRGGIYWTRQFGTPRFDVASSVEVSKSGSIVVAGETDGRFRGQTSKGSTDAFIRKYSPRGGIYWTRQFGRPSYDGATNVASDSRNNIYVVGSSGPRAFVRKYASGGRLRWVRLWGNAQAYGVAIDSHDKLYVTGEAWSREVATRGFVRSFNKAGSFLSAQDIVSGVLAEASVDRTDDLLVGGTIEMTSVRKDAPVADKAFVARIDL